MPANSRQDDCDMLYWIYSQLMPTSFSDGDTEPFKMEDTHVTDQAGNQKLQLRFDVRRFKPEEIEVKWVCKLINFHNSDVTLWSSRLKSPTTWLFVQQCSG